MMQRLLNKSGPLLCNPSTMFITSATNTTLIAPTLTASRAFFSSKKTRRPFASKHDYNVLLDLGNVKPGTKPVPDTIELPPYISDPSYASPAMVTSSRIDPSLLFFLDNDSKGSLDLEKMRVACTLARKVLDYSGSLVQPGVTTEEIDQKVHDFIIEHNAYPSPLDYHGFPKSVCTSVNNVIVHGIPNDRPLENGDIIKIDISIYTDGYHGDNCATFCVGEVDEDASRLIETTKKALEGAIDVCGPNVPFNLIGNTIQAMAEKEGFAVSEAWIGHGIGHHFHCPPCIFHHRNNHSSLMQPGQVFTIEPCLVEGNGDHDVLRDGWTAITKDNSRAAQFEHTVLITHDGVEILTVDPDSDTQ